MKVGHLFAALCLVGWAGAGAAMAEDSRLNVVIGGEAYDGPPRFEVTFNGEPLGEAAVEAAIDTASEGRFADAPDKTPFVQSFQFRVPEHLFRADGEVRIRLLNEAYGGEGSDRDRNLFLAAVTVNGGAVTVSGLVTAAKEGFKPNEIVGEFLVLTDGNEEGVSPAPRGGWPPPNAVVADLIEPRLQPTIDAASSPAMMPVPGITQIRAPETGVTPEVEVAEVHSATANDATAGIAMLQPECSLDQIYNVIGFNENSNDLTARLMARLDQIIGDIGNEKCRVQITGYSSTQGDHATNALFAVERAQNVLRYLRQNGMQFAKVNATGAGATEKFGPDFAANRRVVITVTP
jgi:outer membrane protein OmpA-like peptidoglycan-associated protein